MIALTILAILAILTVVMFFRAAATADRIHRETVENGRDQRGDVDGFPVSHYPKV